MTVDEVIRNALRDVVREELDRALERLSRAPNQVARSGESRITLTQAAARTGYSPGVISRWLDEGKLTRHGRGRLTRIDPAELDRLTSDMGREKSTGPATEAELDAQAEAILSRGH